MSYSLSYDQDADCVVVAICDMCVTIRVVRELAPQVAGLCEKTGCHRILNDMSTAQIDISVLEAFRSPGIMDQSGISRATKRALVLPAEFPEGHFLETVTRNRGHNLKVFTDVAQAKAWLMAGPAGVESTAGEDGTAASA